MRSGLEDGGDLVGLQRSTKQLQFIESAIEGARIRECSRRTEQHAGLSVEVASSVRGIEASHLHAVDDERRARPCSDGAEGRQLTRVAAGTG